MPKGPATSVTLKLSTIMESGTDCPQEGPAIIRAINERKKEKDRCSFMHFRF